MSMEPDVTSPRRITRAGDYDLIRRMGSGGFGVVFEARHRQTGLLYAVKRIELSPEDAERYRNEALYPARIAAESAHVLGVHSFFHDPDADVFYLVTELITHGDLRTFLDQQPRPLPLALALQVGAGIAKGLAAIHAQGIVHRDLKPANVLMDRKDGQWVPKIADFGLARSTRSVSLGEFASSGYAAPEQLDLLSDTPIGPEADLFSFGMVLYELLTGESASRAKDLREYGRWIAARRLPPAPSAVRPELTRWPSVESLVASTLVFDRTRRTTTALACAQVLQNAVRTVDRTVMQPAMRLPVQPPPAPTPTPPPPAPTPIPQGVTPPPAPVPTPIPMPPAPVSVAPAGRPVASPFVPPRPLVTPPVERRATEPTTRSKAPLIGGLVGAVLLFGMIAAGAAWWAWSTYQTRDAARRGLVAYDEGRFGDAFTLFRRAADAGHANAEAYLGLLYVDGSGVARDYAEAKRWFDRAAAKDDPTGHAGLGWMALMGRGVPKDQAEGLRQLRQAADGGDRFGLVWLGWAYETGAGVPKDDVEALKYYRRAADAGSNRARYNVGRYYQAGRGGLEKSATEAARWWETAARAGFADAQCELGDLHRNRFLAAKAPTATAAALADDAGAADAVRWYRMAADKQAACGQNGLGYMYWFGYGVAESYDESIRWYERAAAQGDELATSNLPKLRAGWELPPLFVGAWRQVVATERTQEIDRLRNDGVLARIGTQDARRMRRIDLDFYDGAVLYELEVGRADRGRGILTYIRHGGRLIPIDGQSTQIHELSASAPIRIDTMQRAISFLRFFMGAIQAKDGTFRLVDSGSDVSWLSDAPAWQKTATGLLVQPTTIEPSASGGWQAYGTVQYGNGLFRATIWLKPNGMVEMPKDDPVAQSLPVLQERFDDKGLRVRVGTSAS